jgi:Na+-transporting NADH:ubiquinone oxidoreductase subunit C
VVNKDSVMGTLLVALVLCLVCAIVVSTAAVGLRDKQQMNKELDKKTNILAAAGLLQDGVSVEEQFAKVTTKIVDLATGKYTDAVDPAVYDQRKASKDSSLSIELSSEQDIAKISRQAKYATVYLIEGESGLEQIILPIKGYGLWSTLYGFIALQSDLNTVAGLGFYEQAETPGLGGEVDNPNWKALWVGKEVYQNGKAVITVVKGPATTNYEVDGLSGATLTARGVDNLIKFWMGNDGFEPFLTNLRAGEA